MCTTTRYFFICSHPATYRFRNELCEFSGIRGCQVTDYNHFLRVPCRRCKQRGIQPIPAVDGSLDDPELWDNVWYVPRRCFIDVGFQSLNPFEDDRNKVADLEELDSSSSSAERRGEEPPVLDLDLVSWPTETTSDGVQKTHNLCMKILRRLTRRKASPCCMRESENGAFETCRLECRSSRINGVIKEDHCESIV